MVRVRVRVKVKVKVGVKGLDQVGTRLKTRGVRGVRGSESRSGLG